MRHRPVVAAVVITVAAGVMTLMSLARGNETFVAGQDDPVFERPLTVRQGGVERARLRTAPCTAARDTRLTCSAQPYPRHTVTALEATRPMRFTFSSTGRAELTAWARQGDGYRRIPGWERVTQCIDSACVATLEYPKTTAGPRYPPPGADTLRVVVYGDPTTGAEIALPATPGG